MAGHIPQAFIEDLLSRVDITEVIGSRISLRRAGANLIAKCPFHTEKSPSFTVSPTKQFYHCFGCGATGDAIRFLKEYEGLHFVEAIETLAARVGLTVPNEKNDSDNANVQSKNQAHFAAIYNVLSNAAEYYQKQLRKHPAAKKAQDYLKSRGLTGETAKQFGLGYAPALWDGLIQHICISSGNNNGNGNGSNNSTGSGAGSDNDNSKGNSNGKVNVRDNGNVSDNTNTNVSLLVSAGLVIQKEGGRYYDRFRERILFPIRDRRGRVVGFGGRIIGKEGEPKYLNSPETPVFNKGSELYGLYEARTQNRSLNNLIVVEGYLDVVMLAQNGIKNTVAALGTALTEKHVKVLFTQVSEVIFCFDGDNAGKNAAKRVLPLILPQMKEGRRVKFMILPEGEDPDSLVRKEGAMAFLDRVQRASQLSDFIFESFSTGLDLNHLDNRAELITLTKPLIALLPKGVFQQMMFDRLALLTQVDAEVIQGKKPSSLRTASTTAMEAYSRQSGNIPGTGGSSGRGRKRGITPQALPPNSALRAAAMLIKKRDLLFLIEGVNEFCSADTPGTSLLCAIIKILRCDQNISVEEMGQRLTPDCVGQITLKELQGISDSVPETGIQQEFLGALHRLRERAKEQAMESLLVKAKTGVLTLDEKAHLRNLLDQRQKNRTD